MTQTSASTAEQAVSLALAGKLGKAHSMMLASADVKALAPPSRGVAAWCGLIRALLSQGYLEDAERAVLEARRSKPNHPEFALLHARALFGTDRLDDALDAARLALQLAPDSVEASLQLVRTLLDMGRLLDAETEARGFAARDPEGPVGTTLLALLLRSLGRDGEAVECLRAVTGRHPDYAPAHLALAHSLHDLGSNDDAAACYRRVTALQPQMEDALYGLVNTLADAGRLNAAAAAYSQAAGRSGFNTRWPEFLMPTTLLDTAVPAPGQPPAAGCLSMVLAFVPFELPAVPLAPAALKAFVETHSGHRVTAVDLNARFFQAVQTAVADKLTPFQLADPQGFLAGSEFLSRESADFFVAERYEAAAAAFLQGASVLKAIFSRQCKRMQESDGPLPWHARAMARALLASSPDVVGLSAMFDEQLAPLQAIARAVKLLSPKTPVVVGGGAISNAGALKLLASGGADYVVQHDGEETLLALLDALAGGAPVTGVSRRGADGRVLIADNAVTTKQDRVSAADFSDFDLAAYPNPVPVLPLLTSRGCYWRRCTFCNHFASYAASYKAQSISRVVDEIEAHVRRYGVRHFSLVDEMLSASRFRKIGEEILARNLDIRYYALAKPTAEFDFATLDIMYRSGCRYILWGQESGNERMLAMMDKGNTVASSRETLRAAAQAGLRNHLFLMVGYPTEGLDELADTVRFLRENAEVVDQTQSGPFVLERGTPLYSRPQEFGIAKVYDHRSLGACQLVRFRTATGLQPEQAAVAEKALRRSLFRHFNPFSRYLGDFRDHALIVYSALPRHNEKPAMPSPEEIMAEVRGALGAA